MKTYTLAELKAWPLNQKAYQRALEWVRGGVVWDDWWDDIKQEWLTERWPAEGFNAAGASFTGFSCQGDGACFSGPVNMERYLQVHPLGDEFPELTKYQVLVAMRECEGGIDWDYHISVRGWYSHSGTMELDDNTRAWEPELRAAGLDTEKLEQELTALGKQLLGKAKDLADAYYRELEAEYDYLTSDAHLEELAELNGWRFTNTGARCKERVPIPA